MVGPAKALTDPRFSRVFVCMFSQGGKSRLFFNGMGRRLDDDPAPVLYIGPTRNNVLNVIEPKIDDMLRTCPSLWSKTVHGQKYTKTKKIIAGVSLRFAWAGSPTELAADSACDVYVDEIDRMARDVKGEGNVIELADARHNTYPDGKTIGASTPTQGNVDTYTHDKTGIEHWKRCDPEQLLSAIWSLWQDGTAHEWAWPCPDCHEYFVPRFKNIVYPNDADPGTVNREARLACPHCGSAIESKQKQWMYERGVYVMPGQRPLTHADTDETAHLQDFNDYDAPSLKRKGKGVVEVEFGSYHVSESITTEDLTFWTSGLANWASKKTFGEIAMRFVRAVRTGETEKVQGVLNTQLGECFKFGGDAPKSEEVHARKGPYKAGDMPNGVNVLVCGVDVQKDRLIYSVRGFGKNFSSWGIEYGDLWGDTTKTEVWDQLATIYDREWNGFMITRMGIDSGFRANEVYSFCETHPRALPTKGHDMLSKPFYAARLDVDSEGKALKQSLQLWHFDSDFAKSWVHGRIYAGDEEQTVWMVPGDVSDDYCNQLVAEERMVKPSGSVKWLVKNRNNHFLDCEAINYILARIVRDVHRKISGTRASKPQNTRRGVRSKGLRG